MTLLLVIAIAAICAAVYRGAPQTLLVPALVLLLLAALGYLPR